MRPLRLIAISLLASAACSPARASGSGAEVVFQGMCDASGAVALSDRLFAVADDEDNVLRVYDASRGGPSLVSTDISGSLGLPARGAKGKKRPRKPPEIDIEAATRFGDVALWITSHARNSAGKLKPERLRLFATTAPASGVGIRVVGAPYEGLLSDLIADARFAPFKLAEAAALAPKEPGGLNIEGLTEREGGGVLIGFRNPTPGGKALLAVLLNPLDVIQGKPPRLGDPILLDLGGLGVRSLSRWHGRYVGVAGHHASGAPSKLFVWDGRGKPAILDRLDLRHLNPEGFFTPEGLDRIMLLSDDGTALVDGVECKRLEDAHSKRFRGLWTALPRAAP